jgi:hypothetical protein
VDALGRRAREQLILTCLSRVYAAIVARSVLSRAGTGLALHSPAPVAAVHDRISSKTSSRRRSMSCTETSDSKHRRNSGSVFEGRTLKCQSG